ncbi:hypothetical protein MNBD_ALPHA07-487 [hydrothermal vent metagenome]|uniref:Glycolipid-binding domain-containing protein n=1 Tax=hydrothermal vent metagenome TaxID=652676 RepID=A0A3B0SGM3_9ZZZZ
MSGKTMSGKTIATCTWRALGWDGDDTCRLARVDQGWLLIGHARFRDDLGYAALDYTLRCDHDWHTISADVAGLHGDLEVRIRITHGPEGWILNGAVQPDVDAADDIDLSFTPATNLMPLRRLRASGHFDIRLRAAWLRYPQAVLHPLDQTYGVLKEAGEISYASAQTGFATTLEVDETGFVTLYPGLWQGEVTHAA